MWELRNSLAVAAGAVLVFIVVLASIPTGAPMEPATIRDLGPTERFLPVQPAAWEGMDGRATQVPVLCYHYLRENVGSLEILRILAALFVNLPVIGEMNIWTQTAGSFEDQIVHLKQQGYTAIDMDDLVAWRAGEKAIPEKSVVITFDDGDRSVLDIAYPILRKHGMKATVYIVTDLVGKKDDGLDAMTWQELRLLQHSGVFSIESHTAGMHHKVKTKRGYVPVAIAMSEASFPPPGGTSWEEAIIDDLERSRREIARHTGHEARHLAWPYGFANDALDRLATKTGFHSAATLELGANIRFAREYTQIRRLTITARTSLRGFTDMLPR